MIDSVDNVFHLHTDSTSYLFYVNEKKHLEHLYYGPKLTQIDPVENYRTRYQFELGSATSYDANSKGYMLNHLLLETSTFGKGDYRLPLVHLENEKGVSTTDFKFQSHTIITDYTVKKMPFSRKQKTLKIILKDTILSCEMHLFYSVFDKENVITRHVEIVNTSDFPQTIDRISSCLLDLPYNNQRLHKFDGAWIREKHHHTYPLTEGIVTLDSKKGVSSADHNPSFILEDDTGYLGLALVYSGNFEANFEVSSHQMLRVTMGINSFNFRYTLSPDETFITPEVILSYSKESLDTLSHQFHDFINTHLIRPTNQLERPIIINNWEATYFDFNEKKLLAIAKKAKQLGMELFCLDDGWFGQRDDDTTSLGDWHVHPKKFKKGLSHFIQKVNKLGLQFGLWVEPEMISRTSKLYKKHPNWAIAIPDVAPSLGRNQLLLDLTNSDVRDFIVNTLTSLLESLNIDYIKWDHNRNMSDCFTLTGNLEAFHYDYTRGLYDVLDRVTSAFPEVLFESCASGGNRADLGMLYYMPQTWTSDNTDPFERLFIQEGASYIYPLSNMSNHVASQVSHQMFRSTPLESRFNVAAFGVLGYELDITKLHSFEEKVIKAQISFYKTYRHLFQFGKFYRIPHQKYQVWAVSNQENDEAIVLVYQERMTPNPGFERLKIPFLKTGSYQLTSRKQYFNIRAFGSLVNEALPINLTVNSTLFNTIANRYLFEANQFKQTVHSDTLQHYGITLPHEFTSTGYNAHVMPLPDHYSHLFILKKISEGETHDNN